MCVELDGEFFSESGFELRHEIVSNIRREQARHVFDANGMATHFFEFFGELDEFIVVVNGADGVDEATLNFRLFRAGERGFDCNLQIANVVERVENAKDADTMLRRFLHKLLDNVIGIVIVAEQVLTAKEHLDRSFQTCLELVESLPRIFVEETETCVESCTAPCFEGFVADRVEGFEHRLHLTVAHASRAQRLMTVAQHRLHDLYFVFCHR